MLIKMFSDKMKTNFGWTVCSLFEVIQLLETQVLSVFENFRVGLEGLQWIVRIRNCFQGLDREKLSAQNPSPFPEDG